MVVSKEARTMTNRRTNVRNRILANLHSPMVATTKTVKGVSRRAAIMTEEQLQAALTVCYEPHRLQPERDALLILMTHRLGLRIGEAAQTCGYQFLDASGQVKDSFFVPARIAKNGYDREIPIPSERNNVMGDLKRALIAYVKMYPRLALKPKSRIFFTPTLEPLAPATARKQVNALYDKAGLVNCTSHSGRRSYATRTARNLAEAQCNIRDLQLNLGHAFMSTTEKYIEPTGNRRRLAEMS
jgi:integrase